MQYFKRPKSFPCSDANFGLLRAKSLCLLKANSAPGLNWVYLLYIIFCFYFYFIIYLLVLCLPHFTIVSLFICVFFAVFLAVFFLVAHFVWNALRNKIALPWIFWNGLNCNIYNHYWNVAAMAYRKGYNQRVAGSTPPLPLPIYPSMAEGPLIKVFKPTMLQGMWTIQCK